MDLQLSGKRAIVTGGSRGIGLAVAHRLAREGASVALAARDAARLAEAAVEVRVHGTEVVVRPTDTTDDAAVRAMVDDVVGALGGVDVLVNAAGRPARSAPGPAAGRAVRRRAARRAGHQGARLPALRPRGGAAPGRPGL